MDSHCSERAGEEGTGMSNSTPEGRTTRRRKGKANVGQKGEREKGGEERRGGGDGAREEGS